MSIARKALMVETLPDGALPIYDKEFDTTGASFVQAFVVGEEGGDIYLVFEFVPGQNLSDYLKTNGQLSPVQAIAIVHPVLDAIAHAHAAGIIHRAQPPATLTRLSEAVATLDAFHLAGLSPVVTITGSLVLALALVERAGDPDTLWAAAHVDEDWQAELWGSDLLAEQARANKRREYDAAVAFLAALD